MANVRSRSALIEARIAPRLLRPFGVLPRFRGRSISNFIVDAARRADSDDRAQIEGLIVGYCGAGSVTRATDACRRFATRPISEAM